MINQAAKEREPSPSILGRSGERQEETLKHEGTGRPWNDRVFTVDRVSGLEPRFEKEPEFGSREVRSKVSIPPSPAF